MGETLMHESPHDVAERRQREWEKCLHAANEKCEHWVAAARARLAARDADPRSRGLVPVVTIPEGAEYRLWRDRVGAAILEWRVHGGGLALPAGCTVRWVPVPAMERVEVQTDRAAVGCFAYPREIQPDTGAPLDLSPPPDVRPAPSAAAAPARSREEPGACRQCGAEFGYVSRDHALRTHCRDCAERWYIAENRRRIASWQTEETPGPAPPDPFAARGWVNRIGV